MELQDKLVQYRRELHQYPELSMQEVETTGRLKKWLAENGIFVKPLPLRVGVVAEITGANPGPTIALRSDIDALPIEEETGFAFASRHAGVMHACGHDVHMATMLGAAILLNEQKASLRGKVRILFQPAEEEASGAKWFAAQPGVLDGVQAILGFHNKPDLPAGTIGVRAGALMASVDRFEIEIIGSGGHGGIPDRCTDPIVIGSQLVNAIQTIVSRRLSSLDNAVVSVTKFIAGNTWNIIPATAALAGTVRTFQEEARAQIPKFLQEACDGIALANRAQIKLHWQPSVGVVKNTPALAAVAFKVAEEGGFRVVEAEQSPAGEDFSYYLETLPGCFVWVGTEGPYQWHHPSYTVNEKALSVGARYFCAFAQEVLEKWPGLKL